MKARRQLVQLDMFPEALAPGMNFYARALSGIAKDTNSTPATGSATPAAREREDEGAAGSAPLGKPIRILLSTPAKAGS
ncbi:hypothetical protein GCM10027046_26170 [Uliginosibacterium flavum]